MLGGCYGEELGPGTRQEDKSKQYSEPRWLEWDQKRPLSASCGLKPFTHQKQKNAPQEIG